MNVFPRGKFEGKYVLEVLRTDAWYIKWCCENDYFLDVIPKDIYTMACEYVELNRERKSNFEFSYTVDPNE